MIVKLQTLKSCTKQCYLYLYWSPTDDKVLDCSSEKNKLYIKQFNFASIQRKACHLLAVGSHLVVNPFLEHQVLTTGISHYISALAIWQYAINVQIYFRFHRSTDQF